MKTTERTIGIVSLGCAKNLVDAEIMLGNAAQHGYQLTQENDHADILLINTCGFINPAKEESIQAILEADRTRQETGNHTQKIVVGGCLAQRYPQELARQLPEVDAFLGLDEVPRVGEIFNQLLAQPSQHGPLVNVSKKAAYIPDFDTPRIRLTSSHTRYVKIAEGCNHPCSFCVIPRMRGRHRSRTIDSIVTEVIQLVAQGVKEVNLVSQDTTYFGMDHWDQKAGPRQPVDATRGTTLIELLDRLNAIPGDFWIRLLYTHPAHWSRSLMEAIARNPKVARYIDMPLQHIDETMLTLMRRETGSQHIIDLIQEMRSIIPEITIRTTFIVGFPGETEEHFKTLLNFIEKTRFERLGVFAYSREEGSRAAKMPHQVHGQTKKHRLKEAMLLQQQIAREVAEAQVGKQLRVLADTPYLGRTEGDAPDVDCNVHFTQPVTPGTFLNCKIIDSQEYDLIAH